MATVMQQHPVIEALFWQTGTKGSWRDVGTGEERRSGGRDRNRLDRQEKENVLIDKGWGQERVCQIREEKKMEKVSKEATHTKKKKRDRRMRRYKIYLRHSPEIFSFCHYDNHSVTREKFPWGLFMEQGGEKSLEKIFSVQDLLPLNWSRTSTIKSVVDFMLS